ncbi:MAG: CoB--CoM heterodisulfide reductase iron-sulfur subunit A [ANME-2 cluster archaeon HR1]|jgi:heterodisulfide reductase subunit A|nr:MAG: CoB--CoM heterodisulfide reductase iron-sulfur subunit A [ANME-2 cluster archaeon HR1]
MAIGEKEEPEGEEPRIGVYVCHCGINIAKTVDVEKVRDYAATLPNVVLARDYIYMCSDPGQGLIKNDIKAGKINRVIVASCSPRMHEPTFRKTCVAAGLNPYYFEQANIREQCSWTSEDKEANTSKAVDLVKSAVARTNLLESLEYPKEVDIIPETLIIGAGITGMYAALDIADGGYKVHLVDRNPYVGGHMAQLDKTFPTLDCSACIITPQMVDVGSHPNIDLMTYSELAEVGGYVGNFDVKIKRKARFVDEKLCMGCDMCAQACRLHNRFPNEFDEGLKKRSPIYIAFPYAVPAVYTIDKDQCLMQTKGKCGKPTLVSTREGIKKKGRGEEVSKNEVPPCVAACGPNCINHDAKDEMVELKVGTIIAATGYDIIDPKVSPEYKYGVYPNILTGLEFERYSSASGPTLGEMVINGKVPKDAVFISCVGSRNKQTGYEYCSRVCCMNLAKQAHLLMEKVPDCNVSVLYQDVRAFGKGFEEFYNRVQKEGAHYRRGLPGEIYKKPGSDRVVVRGEDTMLGEPYELEADLVVLGVGLKPSDGVEDLVKITKLSQSADKFFLEAHPKLRPIDTAIDGMFIAGCAQGPKDIPDSVAQGKAASSASLMYLSSGKGEIEAAISEIDEELCTGCRQCEEVCPYNTLSLDEEKNVMTVNETICKGCGACSAACPSGAASMKHYRDLQVYAQIGALTEGLMS